MSAAARVNRLKRKPMDINQASRHLRRATLGVRYDQIAAAAGQRLDQWIDAQFELPLTPNQASISISSERLPGFPTSPVLGPAYAAANQYLNWKFYQPEILRTRLAYVFMEFFSIGGLNGIYEYPYAHGVIWDMVEDAAVNGTFRELIEDITRSGTMARWLTYYKNAKTDGVRQPDENYAREIMQLYTIGLWELNLDGTRIKTGQLSPQDPRYVLNGTDDVPTYGQSDITNMARVFTGMTTLQSSSGIPPYDSPDSSFSSGDMVGRPNQYDSAGRRGFNAKLTFAPSYHETSLPKVALQGRINIPIGTNGDTSLAMALDALVDHPSCAPYLAGRFIRLLTTSNPSPSYVARVASVFRNDGTGQVGNLRAFFKAILLDQESMAPVEKGLTTRVPSYEEQTLAFVLAHDPKLTTEGSPSAFGGGTTYPGSNEFASELIGMDWTGPLQTLQNPSVFGRWPAAYSAAGPVFSSAKLSPELATLTEGGVSQLIDQSGLFERVGNCADPQDLIDVMTTGNHTAVVDRVSFLLTGGTAPQFFKNSVIAWLDGLSSANDATLSLRAATYRSIAAVFWLSPWSISRK